MVWMMRGKGFSLVEILVALGLGGLLLGLGISITHLFNQQAANANQQAETKAQVTGSVDILAKELKGRRVVGVEGGTETAFTALLLAGETSATPTAYGGNTLSLSLAPGVPLPSALQANAPIVLARRGVSAFGTVSTVNASARTLSLSLPSECVTALQGQGTNDPILLYPLERLGMAYDSSSRVLQVTVRGSTYRSEPSPFPLAFAYVYRGSAGEKVLTQTPQGNGVPGVVHAEGGNTYLLSTLVLRSQGSPPGGNTLAVAPVDPLATGLCQGASGGRGSNGGGRLIVRIDDSDAFFNGVYAANSTPDASRVSVSWAGRNLVLRRTGFHELSLVPLANADLVQVWADRPIVATEGVGGFSLSYTYRATPNQASFLGSNLSPFVPAEVDIRYGILPGRITLQATNLPQGGTFTASCSATQGRYANPSGCNVSQAINGSTLTIARPLPPGVYTFSFPPITVQRTATVNGVAVNYTEAYPLQSASPNPVAISSEGDVTLTATYSTTPTNGTLRVRVTGLPSGVNPSYRIYNASGSQVASGTTSSRSFTLGPGGYRILAQTVTYDGVFYDPVAPTGDAVVGVSSGQTTDHTLVYAVRPATIQVNMTGLPEGQGDIRVSGPSGYSRTLTGSTTLTLTTFGTYTFTASDVFYGGKTYRATVNPPSVNAASGEQYTVEVNYQPITTLQVRFNNLTNGGCTNGTLRVRGPGTFGIRYYSADTTELAVPNGNYTASFSSSPFSGLFTCQGSVSPSSLTLSQGDTGTFTATISVTDGALRISLQGYPYSTLGAGHITVRGPSGNALTNPSLVGGALSYPRLAPGTYTITAISFTDPSSGFEYVPSPSATSAYVQAGQLAQATINYTVPRVPPTTAGMRLTVDCPTCNSYQRSNIRPQVCVYIGYGLPSMPPMHLADCPQAVSR